MSSKDQQYDTTSIINEVRRLVEAWRTIPNASSWHVTPETARLLQHWRHHEFSGVRPFFCQVEAVETTVWLTEVASKSNEGRKLLDHLERASHTVFSVRFWLRRGDFVPVDDERLLFDARAARAAVS